MMQQTRGQAEALEWLPRLVLLALAVVIIVMLVRVYTNRDVDASDIGRGAYIYRLYYDDIIMFKDPVTGRVYPGIVDAAKFKSETLDATFIAKEPGDDLARIASRVGLSVEDGCPLESRVIFNNKDTFTKYSALDARPGRLTSGMGTVETVVFPVTVIEGGARCAANLTISVARANT